MSQSLASSTLQTKILYCSSYFVGGIGFFVASFVTFPIFLDVCSSFQIATWAYTLGSLGYIIAYAVEWNNQQNGLFRSFPRCMRDGAASYNFLLSIIACIILLIGSLYTVTLTPNPRDAYFFVGPLLLLISHLWTLLRFLNQKEKTWKESMFEDSSTFFLEFTAIIGSLLYLLASIFTYLQIQNVGLILPIILQGYGGIVLLFSSLFALKKYFKQSTNESRKAKSEEMQEL